MRMFLRESIRHCPQCEEVTPHSQRRIALPKIVAVTAVAAAAVCGWAGSEWFVAAGLLSVVALFALLLDRDGFRYVRCERCRTKLRAQLRKTKPTLDGHTEINIG